MGRRWRDLKFKAAAEIYLHEEQKDSLCWCFGVWYVRAYEWIGKWTRKSCIKLFPASRAGGHGSDNLSRPFCLTAN